MFRSLTLGVLALSVPHLNAQSIFLISNVTVTEKGNTKNGADLQVQFKDAEGTDRTVLYADQYFTVKAWVKVNTHKVKRSSIKDSAVNTAFELELYAEGKKDGRRVEKIFYGDQERKTHIKEVFTIKHGIDVRMITVEYDARLE